MSLTITGVPDCRANLGPSQELKAYQLQPGTADYPSGGYPIYGALATTPSITIEFIYGAWIIGGNATGASYDPQFVLPASSFGTTPMPATQINMKIMQAPVDWTQAVITSGTAVTSTNSALTSNVATIVAPNTFVAGQFVVLQSFANALATAFNGLIVQIASATATQFTFNFTHANIASGADTGTAAPLAGPNGNVIGGATVTSTNSALTSNVATITAPNSFVAGQFVVLQGFSNALATAFNGQVVQIATASATQFTFVFTHANIVSGADTGTAQLLVSGGSPVATGPAASITNSVLTSNVASLTAANSFAATEFVVINGLTNGAALNGLVLQVISTGLTAALFEANYTHANITTGADVGTASPMIATGLIEVPAGTDLSGSIWFAEFLGY